MGRDIFEVKVIHLFHRAERGLYFFSLLKKVYGIFYA